MRATFIQARMPMLTWPERAVLLILLCASAFLFWRRLSPVVKIIRAAKRDPGFHWGSTLRRIRIFVWEVLLQGKVIRQRPLPGIAHAFVFWGFLAFSLITLNHLAIAFGLP